MLGCAKICWGGGGKATFFSTIREPEHFRGAVVFIVATHGLKGRGAAERGQPICFASFKQGEEEKDSLAFTATFRIKKQKKGEGGKGAGPKGGGSIFSPAVGPLGNHTDRSVRMQGSMVGKKLGRDPEG